MTWTREGFELGGVIFNVTSLRDKNPLSLGLSAMLAALPSECQLCTCPQASHLQDSKMAAGRSEDTPPKLPIEKTNQMWAGK